MSFIFNLIQSLFDVISLFVLAYVFMSWFRVDRSNRFVKIVDNVVEPILQPIKKIMPKTGMIDLSPVILLIGIEILRGVILSFI